ncbi:helix-turn-helix transcriptional regulator [Streptomyces atratus]|uniref:helix-turn-helix domain-containing protein n=1 Tax=Streptomyces atratus TaxID=1893 RepID=UPI001671548D|nr:helix-turn-helix transcriptional regulator [Streptomyces atratus]WPW32407.1 helix-turn-helix transcriptional regulator [Streptomyces atratus]GGT38267.1 transcriptional regulator [Streptomyces atratus]
MTTVALDTGVGPLLRSWREQRRISQLELALRADSSARHISFIETGRSRPSEDMILRLAEHLDIPVRERNALLVVAGYAPRYAQTALDDPALGALREGMERLLQGYDPYPALVVDGMYNVVAANRGIAMLLEGVAGHLLAPPLNAMRLTLHPEGLAPRIRNLREWRADLLAQMERQIALARSAELRELYEEVAGYPAPEGADRAEGAGAAGSGGGAGSPVGENPGAGPASSLPFALPLHIEHGGQVLSFVSSIATFNTPMDVTVAELAIETFLPADRATADHLRSLTS